MSVIVQVGFGLLKRRKTFVPRPRTLVDVRVDRCPVIDVVNSSSSNDSGQFFLPTLGNHRRTIAPGDGVEVLPLSHPYVKLGLSENRVTIQMVKERLEREIVDFIGARASRIIGVAPRQ